MALCEKVFAPLILNTFILWCVIVFVFLMIWNIYMWQTYKKKRNQEGFKHVLIFSDPSLMLTPSANASQMFHFCHHMLRKAYLLNFYCTSETGVWADVVKRDIHFIKVFCPEDVSKIRRHILAKIFSGVMLVYSVLSALVCKCWGLVLWFLWTCIFKHAL